MSWNNLDWNNVDALNVRYWHVLYAAMVERLSVSGPLSGAPQASGAPPVVCCAPTVRHMRSLRDAIKAMLPSFYRLVDGEYKAWTLADLYADDARNIERVPNGSELFTQAFGDWLACAKNCLDVMHTTKGRIDIRSHAYYHGVSRWPQAPKHATAQAAIDDAISEISWTATSYAGAGRLWTIRRIDPGDGGPDYYSAETIQREAVAIRNPAPYTAIPLIMATAGQDGYDAVGTGWQEGINTLESLAAWDYISIENKRIANPPDFIPTLDKPTHPIVQWAHIGYELSALYFDFRTEGGFTYYTEETT